jgi:hypothetical protein
MSGFEVSKVDIVRKANNQTQLNPFMLCVLSFDAIGVNHCRCGTKIHNPQEQSNMYRVGGIHPNAPKIGFHIPLTAAHRKLCCERKLLGLIAQPTLPKNPNRQRDNAKNYKPDPTESACWILFPDIPLQQEKRVCAEYDES